MNRERVIAFPNSIFPLAFLVWAVMLCLPEKVLGQSQTFTSSGTFTVPHKITSLQVDLWGGGGGGGGGFNNSNQRPAAGAGGGGFTRSSGFAVTPSSSITVTIGIGGNGGSNSVTSTVGGNTIFGTITANGGGRGNGTTGGIGGGGSGGSYFFKGGDSPNSSGSNNNGGNGGGAAGNSVTIGANGSTNSDDTGGAGGTGANGGGSGGSGGNNDVSGNLGVIPGGGGGGGEGLILIAYPLPPVSPCFKVIDDGSISGVTVIEFSCTTSWTAPEGLTRFTAVVGGAGGGGGAGQGSGGGGAGALVTQTVNSPSPFGFPAGTTFTIGIGIGGLGGPSSSDRGGSGFPSNVSGTIANRLLTQTIQNRILAPVPISITASGGGGGGSTNPSAITGKTGASGGGGGANNTLGGTAGSGTAGFAGGLGNFDSGKAYAGGGGGGIRTAGEEGKAAGAGQGEGGGGGGAITFAINGVTYSFGAGGGGVGFNFNGTTKVGNGGTTISGTKVGGDGSITSGLPGIDKTGSGGGAGRDTGGKGGNGTVYIYYDNFRILPVEFLYFNAKIDELNRTGNLSWSTAQEWDNSHFEIERSVNGVTSWTKIGEIEGKGYSETPTEYNFTDSKLLASGGIVYYRLRQMDFNGKFAYSVTKSIKVEGLDGKGAWIVYPNPSSKKSTVTVDLRNRSVYSDEALLIQISDIKGVSETFTVNQIESVSEVVNAYLDRSIPGVYILQLIWGNNAQQLKLLRE